jgi:hypothetical protein
MLEVAGRAVQTLRSYVDRLGLQMQYRYPVRENEKILSEIRGVSSLISDILPGFHRARDRIRGTHEREHQADGVVHALFQILTVFLT